MFVLKIIDILRHYTRCGQLPPQTFMAFLRANKWKTNPSLHPLLDMLVASLEALREEPRQYQRRITATNMLSRVLGLMRETDEPSVQKALPQVQAVVLGIEQCLAQEREVFSQMLPGILAVLDTYSHRGVGCLEEIMALLREYMQNCPMNICHLLQAFITAFEAMPDEPCPLLRLEHARSMLLQFLALMRSINDASVQQAIPRFEEFLCEQERSIARHNDAVNVMVQAFGRVMVFSSRRGNSYQARELLTILMNFFQSCAVVQRPLIQAFINALEALPNIDCELCQNERVQDVFRQVIALMRLMSNRIVAAIPLLEGFLREIEDRMAVMQASLQDIIQDMHRDDDDDRDGRNDYNIDNEVINRIINYTIV